MPARGRSIVDVVVVAYNSRRTLRACVEPLARLRDVHVVVVDNASQDDGLSTVADLPLEAIPLTANGGFAVGNNVGCRAGSAPYVLVLNPDSRIDERSLRRLVARLERDPALGAAAPLILDIDGSIDYSLRRHPRLRSTYAQALFLHRLFPRASWTDEIVRDDASYAGEYRPEWVSGACILLRRSALEALGGFDERFFLYREDADLCRRLRDAGWGLLFDPAARCIHEGGASGDRSALRTVYVQSRIEYARKHCSRAGAIGEWIGVLLGAFTHMVISRGVRRRVGHARALAYALRGGTLPSG